MQRLADSHAPEFLEIDVTMPQAKLLYLLGAAGELHMSELVARLGVSLSTVSGLVDRVVDHGLATRREDPADRRQVLVGPDARRRRLHRPLPRAQRAPDARAARGRSTTPASGTSGPPSTPSTSPPRGSPRPGDPTSVTAASRPGATSERTPHEPPLRVRRRQAERHAPAGRGAVRRRSPRLGQPQAGAAARHRVPGHHRHRAAPRRRRGRRRRPGDEAHRARDLRRAAARGAPVDVGELAVAGRRPVPVRLRRQGDPGDDRAEPPERRAAQHRRAVRHRAQHQLRRR